MTRGEVLRKGTELFRCIFVLFLWIPIIFRYTVTFRFFYIFFGDYALSLSINAFEKRNDF